MKRQRKKKTTKLFSHWLLTFRQCIGVIIGVGIFVVLLCVGYLLWGRNMIIPFYPVAASVPPNFSRTLFPPVSPLPSEVITHGSRMQKKVALTFDADMTKGMRYELLSGQVKSWYDKRIVNILIQTKTKATFFLTGMWIELYPKETESFSFNPLFELANHSYSHPSFDGYCYGLKQVEDSMDKKDQIMKTQKLLKDVAGVDNKYFRFPGGCYSQNDVKIVTGLGLQVVHWDVVSNDAFNTNAPSIITTVLDRVANGSIIVMHLNGPPNAPETAVALPEIIKTLKSRGYTFVKVSDLLGQS